MKETKELLPHQQRVMEEYRELGDRWNKLKDFINTNPMFEKLAADEQGRLKHQAYLMGAYLTVLQQRFEAF